MVKTLLRFLRAVVPSDGRTIDCQQKSWCSMAEKGRKSCVQVVVVLNKTKKCTQPFRAFSVVLRGSAVWYMVSDLGLELWVG